MGRTLAAKHITVANAFQGKVPRDTQIPGTDAKRRSRWNAAVFGDAA